MADTVSSTIRSRMMASVRQKNTEPEIVVRSLLHRMGYRFRLHRKDLPGKPDIVLPRHKSVVFVNGCFWHQHPGCKLANRPSTNVKFWDEKLNENIKRDSKNISALRKMGWRALIVWGCEIRNIKKIYSRLKRFLDKCS